jgi:bifunctional NMN adenylyltransferase/nudix hydrolase
VIIAPLPDIRYNDTAWIRSVQSIVAAQIGATVDEKKVALTGFGKDASSYYLKMFPEWGSINVESQFATYNSTDIRKAFLRPLPSIPTARVMHPNNIRFLGDFSMSAEFKSLVAEAKYLKEYAKEWGSGPFITVDAVVIQSGHILLVTRGDNPGKGLLALPGGFVNKNEPIRKAAVRELMEETKLCDNKGEMPKAVVASYMQEEHTKVFDDPDRSLRGRIITFAHLFKLPDSKKLWKVTGSDDAADARWFRLGDLRSEDFFEDHWHIINGFICAGI